MTNRALGVMIAFPIGYRRLGSLTSCCADHLVEFSDRLFQDVQFKQDKLPGLSG